MRIDLKCPAEMLGAELPTEESPFVLLTLMDLTDRGIVSCEATVKLLDRDGQVKVRTVHRARALEGRPHSTFSMAVPMEPAEGAEEAEVTLDKVWFEDNDIWRRNPSEETEYEPNALPPGNDLNALRYTAGPAAVGFPSQQAAVWVCVWPCVAPGCAAGSSVFLSPQALSAAAAMPAAKQSATAFPVNFMMFMFTPVAELSFVIV